MAKDETDKADYVLVYDGEGGVRMAPRGARIDLPPEGHMSWPSDDEPRLSLETVTAPRRPAYVLPVVGAACLCLVGLGLGFAARPKLSAIVPPAPAPMQPAPQQTDAQMQVTVLDPVPAPVAPPPSRVGRLEVLPADQRQVPGRRVVAAAPAAPPLLPVTAPPPAKADPAPLPAVDASARASDHVLDGCERAPSLAAAMICRDPELQTADRRLRRAFRAAMRSGGMSPGQLRAEQDDWLAIREDAAERSPHALAQVYDQRIGDLEALASDSPPDR